MSELASGLDNPLIKGIGLPGQEDSSLILLYLQLRDWSLQTLQGSAAIAPIRETQVRKLNPAYMISRSDTNIGLLSVRPPYRSNSLPDG